MRVCRGFRKIGGPIWMSALAVPIIHLTFAYWTQDSWIPSPALGIYTKNIHRVGTEVSVKQMNHVSSIHP